MVAALISPALVKTHRLGNAQPQSTFIRLLAGNKNAGAYQFALPTCPIAYRIHGHGV
jgi:hypothetical protein